MKEGRSEGRKEGRQDGESGKEDVIKSMDRGRMRESRQHEQGERCREGQRDREEQEQGQGDMTE